MFLLSPKLGGAGYTLELVELPAADDNVYVNSIPVGLAEVVVPGDIISTRRTQFILAYCNSDGDVVDSTIAATSHVVESVPAAVKVRAEPPVIIPR